MTETIIQRVEDNQFKQAEDICDKIIKFLYRMEIYPNIKKQEFNYFYTAIMAYIKKIPQYVMIEEIYKEVSYCYNTTWREVEHVIKVALRRIEKNPEFEDWKKEIIGNKPNKKMRDSQVIMYIAKYLK